MAGALVGGRQQPLAGAPLCIERDRSWASAGGGQHGSLRAAARSHLPLLLQLAAAVMAGRRPEVPPREELPGHDTAQVGLGPRRGWGCKGQHLGLRLGWPGAVPMHEGGLQLRTPAPHRCASAPPACSPAAAHVPQFGGLDAYLALMRRCWAADPAERPGFAEVVRQLRCARGAAVRPGCLLGAWAAPVGLARVGALLVGAASWLHSCTR